LLSRRVPVVAFDPAAEQNAAGSRRNQIELSRSATDCVAQADVVVITTPWPEFSTIDHAAWARPGQPRIVIDCWRSFDFLRHIAGVSYISLGSGVPLTSIERPGVAPATAELGQESIRHFVAETGTD